MHDLTTFLTGIGTAAAVTSLIIQHRRTPKLPEPAFTPTCTTILGVDTNRNICNLPGYTHDRLDETAEKTRP